MTIKKITVLLILTLVAFFSCDEIDKLTEIDVTDSFDETINVSVPEATNGGPQAWSESITLDIASNQQIQDNLELIQDIEINALNFEISNFSGAEDAVLTDASISIDNFTFDISDINLKESDDNDVIISISDPTQLNALANYLKIKPSITVTISGQLSATPVDFDIIATLDVTITIDVI
ncbi:hypothetical protein GCM10023311_07040 [Flaviramulus aquimarinus]|uniref:Uncharacterized protein n=1 Tax=Flaviramulus aquimarinus TaxID=1170456 RepID=A0ABP9ESS9_9FLAO